METVRELHRGAVREGYRLLLRIETEVLAAEGYESINDYYRRMVEACSRWVGEVTGERIRREYLALGSDMERARQATARYHLRCAPIWWEGRYGSWLAESRLTVGGAERYRRMARVWDLEEQTMLPVSQILGHFGNGRMPKGLSFQPDGVYPVGRTLIFYRNAHADGRFCEWRMAMPPRE